MTNKNIFIVYPYQSLNKYQELICDGLENLNYKVLRESPSGLARLVATTLRFNRAFFNIHWIDPIATEGSLPLRLIRILVFMLCMYCYSLNGRLIWTIHNDCPHDSRAGHLFRLLFSYLVPNLIKLVST